MTNVKWFSERALYGSVAEVPGFPFRDWDSAVSALRSGAYDVRVDCAAANALAPLVGGTAFFSVLMSVVTIAGIASSIALAVVMGRFAFLWGIPIVVCGFVVGGPTQQKGCPLWSALWFASVAACLVAIVKHSLLFGFLAALYPTVVLCVGAYYWHNVEELLDAVLRHEAVFLYALEKRAILVVNKETGETVHIVKQEPTRRNRGPGDQRLGGPGG